MTLGIGKEGVILARIAIEKWMSLIFLHQLACDAIPGLRNMLQHDPGRPVLRAPAEEAGFGSFLLAELGRE